jgi:NTE family protein
LEWLASRDGLGADADFEQIDLTSTIAKSWGGEHYGRMAAVCYRKLGESKFFPLYAGLSLEAGNVFQNRDDISFDNMLYAGSLWVAADTPIGPLYVACGYADGGASSFHIFLGRAF